MSFHLSTTSKGRLNSKSPLSVPRWPAVQPNWNIYVAKHSSTFCLLAHCYASGKNGFPSSKHLQLPQSYQSFKAQLKCQFLHKGFPSHSLSIYCSPWISTHFVLALPTQLTMLGWVQSYIPHWTINSSGQKPWLIQIWISQEHPLKGICWGIFVEII